VYHGIRASAFRNREVRPHRRRNAIERPSVAPLRAMLTIYGKNVSESIPSHLLEQMKEAIDDEEAR
jgi:hypothetical protein